MKAITGLTGTILTAVLAAGCGGSAAPPAGQTVATPAVHAPADSGTAARDWCAEHAVAESLCTRCNAELIPAFKATGDWCAEHAVPESQCRLCSHDTTGAVPRPGGGG